MVWCPVPASHQAGPADPRCSSARSARRWWRGGRRWRCRSSCTPCRTSCPGSRAGSGLASGIFLLWEIFVGCICEADPRAQDGSLSNGCWWKSRCWLLLGDLGEIIHYSYQVNNFSKPPMVVSWLATCGTMGGQVRRIDSWRIAVRSGRLFLSANEKSVPCSVSWTSCMRAVCTCWWLQISIRVLVAKFATAQCPPRMSSSA